MSQFGTIVAKSPIEVSQIATIEDAANLLGNRVVGDNLSYLHCVPARVAVTTSVKIAQIASVDKHDPQASLELGNEMIDLAYIYQKIAPIFALTLEGNRNGGSWNMLMAINSFSFATIHGNKPRSIDLGKIPNIQSSQLLAATCAIIIQSELESLVMVNSNLHRFVLGRGVYQDTLITVANSSSFRFLFRAGLGILIATTAVQEHLREYLNDLLHSLSYYVGGKAEDHVAGVAAACSTYFKHLVVRPDGGSIYEHVCPILPAGTNDATLRLLNRLVHFSIRTKDPVPFNGSSFKPIMLRSLNIVAMNAAFTGTGFNVRHEAVESGLGIFQTFWDKLSQGMVLRHEGIPIFIGCYVPHLMDPSEDVEVLLMGSSITFKLRASRFIEQIKMINLISAVTCGTGRFVSGLAPIDGVYAPRAMTVVNLNSVGVTPRKINPVLSSAIVAASNIYNNIEFQIDQDQLALSLNTCQAIVVRSSVDSKKLSEYIVAIKAAVGSNARVAHCKFSAIKA